MTTFLIIAAVILIVGFGIFILRSQKAKVRAAQNDIYSVENLEAYKVTELPEQANYSKSDYKPSPAPKPVRKAQPTYRRQENDVYGYSDYGYADYTTPSCDPTPSSSGFGGSDYSSGYSSGGSSYSSDSGSSSGSSDSGSC